MAFSDRSDIHKFSATDDENLNIGAVVDDIRLGESSGPTAEATRTSDFNNGLRALMGAIKRAIFGPSLTVRGDGASSGGALALNSADNAAAVTLKGPASGATSYAGVLPGTAPAQSAGGKITALAAGVAFDTDGKLDWMDGQAYSARLTDIAALTPTSGQVIQWNGSNWIASSTSLGDGAVTAAKLSPLVPSGSDKVLGYNGSALAWVDQIAKTVPGTAHDLSVSNLETSSALSGTVVQLVGSGFGVFLAGSTRHNAGDHFALNNQSGADITISKSNLGAMIHAAVGDVATITLPDKCTARVTYLGSNYAFVTIDRDDGIALTSLSVASNAASGAGALSYDSVTGQFSYTPPDLSGKQGASANLDAWSQKAAPTGAAIGTTDTQTLSNKTLQGPIIQEIVQEQTASLDQVMTTLSSSNGSMQKYVLTGNLVFSGFGLTAGKGLTVTINNAGTYTVDWSNVVGTWVNNGGSAPTFGATNEVTVAIWFDGTTVYGAVVGAE